MTTREVPTGGWPVELGPELIAAIDGAVAEIMRATPELRHWDLRARLIHLVHLHKVPR
jgi:hypothetical protein